MKITRYEHACMVVEQGNSKLVIDPGSYSRSFKDYSGVTVLVITHVHQDHFDDNHVQQILKASPAVQIFTTQQTADKLPKEAKITMVTGGDHAEVGDFKLDFFGGQHAIIDSSMLQDQNVGVLVNDTLYYPGDSFSLPEGKSIPVLAIPGAGPWMKIGEAMEFMRTVKPKQTFPVHNAILSEAGLNFQNQLLDSAAQQVDAHYESLQPGSSLDA